MAYEILAVRYGTRRAMRSEVFLNFAVYGEPDAELGMDYYFWVIRDGSHVIIVDTGFSAAGGARRRRTRLAEPAAVLAGLGIAPGLVPQVLVTHAHYDHVGGLPAYDSAEVIMAEREYGFWTGPMAGRALFAHSAEQSELDHLAALRASGRLTLFTGARAIAPGIEMVETGGHTPGQAVVLVDAAGGQVILASDALHYYEEAERDRPFSVLSDLAGMYRTFDMLRELDSRPGSRLVAGHDPAVRSRFGPAAGGSGAAAGMVTRIA
jgi:glyoxylase-like metal-dependent hydrolase (beta-lactamase superfamily II)